MLPPPALFGRYRGASVREWIEFDMHKLPLAPLVNVPAARRSYPPSRTLALEAINGEKKALARIVTPRPRAERGVGCV